MNEAAAAPAPRPGRLYWICQCGGWGGYALLQITGAVNYLGLDWQPALRDGALLYGCAFLATHLLRAFMKRRRWDALSRGRLTMHIIGAGLVLGAVLGTVSNFTSLGAIQDPGMLDGKLAWHVGEHVVLLLNILNWACIIMLWLAIYFGVHAFRQYTTAELRQSELTRALQLAELRLLESQLNPHFLFNALNTVRSLIAEDPRKAQGAVTRLANTLRYTLASGRAELVTLEQELDTVKDYLELEALRFEDRLRMEWDVAAAARGVRIPVMLLQTVVENAIKHGIADLPEGGVLRIHAGLQDGALVMEVQNPRPQKPASGKGEGIGLRNAAERLRLLFGPHATLDLDLSQPGLAITRIRIPQSA